MLLLLHFLFQSKYTDSEGQVKFWNIVQFSISHHIKLYVKYCKLEHYRTYLFLVSDVGFPLSETPPFFSFVEYVINYVFSHPYRLLRIKFIYFKSTG